MIPGAWNFGLGLLPLIRREIRHTRLGRFGIFQRVGLFIATSATDKQTAGCQQGGLEGEDRFLHGRDVA